MVSLVGVLTGSSKLYLTEKKERIKMCEALEKIKSEGKTELVITMLKKGKTVQEVSELTDISEKEIEEMKRMMV